MKLEEAKKFQNVFKSCLKKKIKRNTSIKKAKNH